MLIWHDDAWLEYLEWQKLDAKKCSKLNLLIKEVMRDPFSGTGKPEPLKGNLFGFWSRRIDKEHRLVYRVCEDGIEIAQCRGHY
ncbi:Txe/YoeB family addiction module toxin [Turicimonas muris]|uniref:Txe/YoeB family addiction module toxin n=1 Tax=Turicimonas muris TaxID=1796652 RepID=UPI0023F3D0E2|nr:Txe/YoeB family addiction module toxin [Turicimonas muris]MBS4769192.1 Txe/YoeB family addiction module toxin [Burkholderiales bacterium]